MNVQLHCDHCGVRLGDVSCTNNTTHGNYCSVACSDVSEQEAKGIVRLDNVNSPAHYTNARFETIEVIEEITAGYSDGFVAYSVGNALKYLARAPFKHDDGGLEDVKKAAKYLEFAIKRIEAKQSAKS
jgi:hypothetical protein